MHLTVKIAILRLELCEVVFHGYLVDSFLSEVVLPISIQFMIQIELFYLLAFSLCLKLSYFTSLHSIYGSNWAINIQLNHVKNSKISTQIIYISIWNEYDKHLIIK